MLSLPPFPFSLPQPSDKRDENEWTPDHGVCMSINIVRVLKGMAHVRSKSRDERSRLGINVLRDMQFFPGYPFPNYIPQYHDVGSNKEKTQRGETLCSSRPHVRIRLRLPSTTRNPETPPLHDPRLPCSMVIRRPMRPALDKRRRQLLSTPLR